MHLVVKMKYLKIGKKHYKLVNKVKKDNLIGTFKIYDVRNRNKFKVKGEFKSDKIFSNDVYNYC